MNPLNRIQSTQTLSRFLFYSVLMISSPIVLKYATAQSDSPDVWRTLQHIQRGIPESGDHPGNVFLEGEEVRVRIPSPLPDKAVRWRILDDRDTEVGQGELSRNQTDPISTIEAGQLGIGWYRIDFLDTEFQCLTWTSAAVLAKLAAPVPQDSPICLDGANAWFAKDDPAAQERLARLAALAGVNWIRDRIRWREIQPEPDRFESETTYDTSADFQAGFGLKTLQVFHDTPPWALDENSRNGRFPRDLRHVYSFCKAMSERFKDSVQAWEPWNEANVANFGAHTADEMCSMQKAAYLGFKAGQPEVTVGWNAYAGVPSSLHTRSVLANETWSYYDTYNIHTYDWPDSYSQLRKPAIEAACGRPLWLTESDRGIACLPDNPWLDLSRENEHLKAEFMAQSYATSLFAGCQRHFHFVLGHYSEGTIQFGLLRLDMTPRPSYVALAALGRFLAGAKCLGQWKIDGQPLAHVYAFRAKPDGIERTVLVAWAEQQGDWAMRGKVSIEWPLPDDLPIEGLYDYLGRSLGKNAPKQLTSSAIFIILPPDEAQKYPLKTPPVSPYRTGTASPIVLQVQMPLSTITKIDIQPWTHEYGYLVKQENEMELTFFAYHFGETPVHGEIVIDHAPDGWNLTPDRWEVSLDPMKRERLTARLVIPKRENDRTSDTWIKLRGDFGNEGKPILAFRLIAFPDEGYER